MLVMNIQSILKRLAKAGISDAEIGKNIKAPASIVQRLRTGIHKTTSYERGIKIIEFYEEYKSRVAA